MSRPVRPQQALLHAVRTAGPTRWWLVAGAAVSVAIMIVVAFGLRIWDPRIAILVTAVTFGVVGLLDRDAWVARCAIYQFGALQAQRIGPTFPTDPSSIETWLADPAHAADDITRAYVLLNADRPDEAMAAVDLVAARGPTDAASVERLRLAVQRRRKEPVDLSRFDALTASLPPNERRFQLLSMAAMLLKEDVADGRPWRDRFVAAIRDLAPWQLSRRAWFVVVTQQFTMAISFALLLLVVVVFGVLLDG